MIPVICYFCFDQEGNGIIPLSVLWQTSSTLHGVSLLKDHIVLHVNFRMATQGLYLLHNGLQGYFGSVQKLYNTGRHTYATVASTSLRQPGVRGKAAHSWLASKSCLAQTNNTTRRRRNCCVSSRLLEVPSPPGNEGGRKWNPEMQRSILSH